MPVKVICGEDYQVSVIAPVGKQWKSSDHD